MSLNDFEIGNVLGKGAFGSVMIAKRKEDGKIYAMKRVKIIQLTPKDRENAFNEVRILASLSHSNIIGYKEAFFDGSSQTLNIIMEFADDGDLASKIKKNTQFRLMFHEATIWQWLIQIIQGLQYLHDNKIMHRDLKSANIFLMKNGTVKLGDLNVSKIAKLGMAYTQTGTPYYASPEIWKDQPYDYKCDIWSVGCIIYELCTLKPPFRGTSLNELKDNITLGRYDSIPLVYSNDLAKIIGQMLIVEPNRRPNCSQLLCSDIILRKTKEIKLESVDKGKVNLMKTIKVPRDIRDINKELPKKRYTKIREEEMLENDEYETKKNFYKPNEVNENKVNVIIYERNDNKIEEKKNVSKEKIDIDEVNKQYFMEKEKERERENERERERERQKEKEKEKQKEKERERFKAREREMELERERDRVKEEIEYLRQKEIQNQAQHNQIGIYYNKRRSSEKDNKEEKNTSQNKANEQRDYHQDKKQEIKPPNQIEAKKQMIANEYKHESEIIKNNRNYINEYLEREKNSKLPERNINKTPQGLKQDNAMDPIKDRDRDRDKEIEQMKDKYKLLLINPNEPSNRNKPVKESDKKLQGNNLVNYHPSHLNINNLQLAQEKAQKPKNNSNNLVNQRIPSAYNVNYNYNQQKQFIYNYKEYLPSNNPKEVSSNNNLVRPSYLNNKYEPKKHDIMSNNNNNQCNYNLNNNPNAINHPILKEKKYEPIGNHNHYQPINLNHYPNRNRENLGNNRRAVIEKLDYKNYLIKKNEDKGFNKNMYNLLQPNYANYGNNNNGIGKINIQQNNREYKARAFAIDQKLIRNGPKLLQIKR